MGFKKTLHCSTTQGLPKDLAGANASIQCAKCSVQVSPMDTYPTECSRRVCGMCACAKGCRAYTPTGPDNPVCLNYSKTYGCIATNEIKYPLIVPAEIQHNNYKLNTLKATHKSLERIPKQHPIHSKKVLPVLKRC